MAAFELSRLPPSRSVPNIVQSHGAPLASPLSSRASSLPPGNASGSSSNASLGHASGSSSNASLGHASGSSSNAHFSSSQHMNTTLDAISKTVNDNSLSLRTILEEQRRLWDAINEFAQRSFSIESSAYKDDLLKACGVLFCKTLNRMPTDSSIKAAVNSVLKKAVEEKYKYEAAISFCKSKLSELRAEERRRIFGHHPCQSFALMKAEDIVIKFIPVLKVEFQSIPTYVYHVAMLRRYCRTVEESKTKTYKRFVQWLCTNYHQGKPSREQMEAIYEEEEALLGPPPEVLSLAEDQPFGVDQEPLLRGECDD